MGLSLLRLATLNQFPHPSKESPWGGFFSASYQEKPIGAGIFSPRAPLFTQSSRAKGSFIWSENMNLIGFQGPSAEAPRETAVCVALPHEAGKLWYPLWNPLWNPLWYLWCRGPVEKQEVYRHEDTCQRGRCSSSSFPIFAPRGRRLRPKKSGLGRRFVVPSRSGANAERKRFSPMEGAPDEADAGSLKNGA